MDRLVSHWAEGGDLLNALKSGNFSEKLCEIRISYYRSILIYVKLIMTVENSVLLQEDLCWLTVHE